MDRHKDAWEMNEHGACNPIAIANNIVEACRQIRDEGGDTHNDTAIKLMVHQLATATGATGLFVGTDSLGLYQEMMRECKHKF